MQCDDADTFFWTQSLSGMLEKVSVALIDIWTSLCCLVALLAASLQLTLQPMQSMTLLSPFSVQH